MTRRIERGEEREKQVHEQEQQREELELELELEEILQQEERGGNKNGDRSILVKKATWYTYANNTLSLKRDAAN